MIVPFIIPILSKFVSSRLFSLVLLPCFAFALLVAIFYLVRHFITGRD